MTPSATTTRPTLTTEQWRRVFELYDRAAEEGVGEGETEEIRAALAYLRDTRMKNAPETREFESVANSIATSVLGLQEPAIGATLGRYRLLSPIARGGMGSVWRGERADGLYAQNVAIKLLGSLAISQQARARFIREGELLAKLNHPNIARLHDVGLTEDGQRFLAIELIEGEDISAHCKETSLNETLAVFRQLLSAVAYSHSQLVLHRDIKPANVLVDRAGQVKLLDFGVAKLADDEADDDGLTRSMGRALTERYAAPEQYLDDNVGTSADIFALGSLLVELLSGERIEWSHPKKEWVNGSLAVSLKTSLANVPEDLRAIATKATSREPGERYASVGELDDDVARFLASEPVRARPASAWYRFAKFVKRHRGSFGAGVAAALAVIASLVFAVIQLIEARDKQRLAAAEAERAGAVSMFLVKLFTATDVRQLDNRSAANMTARELLDAGAKQVELSFDDQPETKIALLGTLADVYGQTGNGPRSGELRERMTDVALKHFGPTHPAIHDAKLENAQAFVYHGDYEKARALLLELDEFVVKNPTSADSVREREARRLHARARLERRANVESLDRVLERFSVAIAAFERANGTSGSEHHAAALANYAVALRAANRLQDSLAQLNRAAAILSTPGNAKRIDIRNLANVQNLRGQLLTSLKRPDEALAAFSEAMNLSTRSAGPDNITTLTIRLNRARALHQTGQRTDGWRELDEVALKYAAASPNPAQAYEVDYIRGLMLLDDGAKVEAVNSLDKALQGWRLNKANPTRVKAIEDLLASAKLSR
jgi:eukaryotic-like serine/threonine-protein kinase